MMSIEVEGVNVMMPVPLSYIYRISNSLNDKSYIGQTTNITRRITEHLTGSGSHLLLVDLVKQGVKQFDFEVLDIIYTDIDVSALEDRYIKEYDSLCPNGYNQCINAPIVPDGDSSNELDITGKYVYSTPTYHVFTIGEHTQARSYQSLINLKNNFDTTMLIKRKRGKFYYFELRVESDRQFVKNKTYTMRITYNMEDYFTL